MARVQGKFLQHGEYTLFHLERVERKETLIVAIHGLGDSHLNYRFLSELSLLDDYDLFIPDLLGHGKSGTALKYNYQILTDCLAAQLQQVIAHYEKVVLVPHSIAGIPATLLCKGEMSSCISGIFALETTLTQYGSLLTESLSDAVTENEPFTRWFAAFQEKIYEAGKSDPVFRRYHAGLQFVDPLALLSIGMETRALATCYKDREFTNKMGYAFAALCLPTLYCFSAQGKQQQSIPFLKAQHIASSQFPSASHWVAQACPQEFATRLRQFISDIAN